MAKVRKRGNTYQIDYFDPAGKRVRKSFKKKRDAEGELGKRVSLIQEHRYLDVKKEYTTTLKMLLEKYEENYNTQPTYQSWKRFCVERIKAHFGEDTLLSSIRYVDLETYRNKLRQNPTKYRGLRKDATINREMSCLHHIMAKGAEWDMIERNPFENGKSLLVKENNERLRFLTEDEIKSLLQECPKHVRHIAVCALNTGMRRGEILSLRWDQIRNGFIYLQKTETNEARQIPVNDTLAEMFKTLKLEQGPGAESVFTYAKGEHNLKGKEPVRKRKKLAPVPDNLINVKRAFTSSIARAGIKDFHFHDLRHTFASQMIMRGASLKEVQEILGHKTMTMTLRYAHLSEEHKKKAVNLLNGLTALKAPADSTCHKVSQNLVQSVSAIG